MSDQWSNFQSVSKDAGREDSLLDDDDDFGEFGGFEAADAIPNNEAQPLPQGVQASPSPWALFPGSGIQPDLLLSQMSSVDHPYQQDRADSRSLEEVIQADVAAANFANFSPDVNAVPSNGKTSNGGFPSHIDAILEPTFSEAQLSQSQAASTTQAFPPALDLDLTQTGLLELDLAQGTGDIVPKSLPQVSVLQENSQQPDISASVESSFTPALQSSAYGETFDKHGKFDPESKEFDLVLAEVARAVPPGGETSVENAADIKEEKISLFEKEENHLLEDFQKLKITKEKLEHDLKECEDKVEEQKAKYEKLQETHAQQLEEVRKGGHDALSVVTQEYKELCKTSVLEQQAASEKHLQAVLNDQAEKFQEILEAQHTRLGKILEEEKAKMEDKIREALECETQRHKESLEKALEGERQKSQEAIEEALQAERRISQEAVETAVKAEEKKTELVLQKEKEKFQEFLKAEREESAKKLKEAIEAERVESKKLTEEALEEERQHSKDLVKQALQQAREEMKDYVAEQKQADSILRQRSLTSMDILLESVRTQLHALMNSHQTNPSDNNMDKDKEKT